MFRPTPGQRFHTASGGVFVVHKVVGDELDPDNYLVQLVTEDREGDFLAETVDVHMAEWEAFCSTYDISTSQFGDLPAE